MAKAPKKPRKKAANGYQMPEPLPEGEILTDISKKQWRLGPSIGKGGFGEIYSAQEASSKSSKYPFVIKVEPHENGPLFVEMHFYMKNAKKDDIEDFKKKHKLETFGMPAYIGSGSHETGSVKFRFIVIEKFGTHIDKLRLENGGVLPVSTVFQLAWQMMYVLEYIHSFHYVHADIKGANILMGITAETKNQAFLVDFGLAMKATKDKEFKPNPKKAHDGTIEYLSRDAHQGVPTRRGDLEILGYNMVHWISGKLPWESKLNDPKLVQQMKEDCMNDIPKFLKTCLKDTVPSSLVQFFKYVNTLEFNEKPNYGKIRNMFEGAVKKNGSTIDSPLEFCSSRKRRSLTDRQTPEKKSREEEEEMVKKGTKPKVVKKKGKKEQEDSDHELDNVTVRRGKKKEPLSVSNEVLTDAMKEVLAKKEKKLSKKKAVATMVVNDESDEEENFDGYTEEMKQIKMKKMKSEKTSTIKKKGGSSPVYNGDAPRSRRNVPLHNYAENSV